MIYKVFVSHDCLTRERERESPDRSNFYSLQYTSILYLRMRVVFTHLLYLRMRVSLLFEYYLTQRSLETMGAFSTWVPFHSNGCVFTRVPFQCDPLEVHAHRVMQFSSVCCTCVSCFCLRLRRAYSTRGCLRRLRRLSPFSSRTT